MSEGMKATELNQFLTFTLEKELYALEISTVREILDDKNITAIPRVPPFIRGVINLRGGAVPVIDLRLKFGMPKTQMLVNTCIIITDVIIENEPTVIGALADSVQEVVEILPEHIDPAPRMGTCIDTRFIKGMGKRDNHFIMILDINAAFSEGELAMVKTMDAKAEAELETAEA